jgi:Uma2 family endonuclease
MSVSALETLTLPDSPYAMWVRDELADWLQLPEGTRVEVIGGDVFVSPGPAYAHSAMITDVQNAFAFRLGADPVFGWRTIQNQDLDLTAIADGYIPDLAVIATERHRELRSAPGHLIHPEDVELVVEVTSPGNALNDRPQDVPRLKGKNKWYGYARTGVPFYLLVDRQPRASRAILYSEPDQATGRYLEAAAWKFGDPISLPEPFGVEIDTGEWQPWA